MKKKLTYKQEVFCQEYSIDYNATRAYMIAYPNVKKAETAKAAGSRLLTIVNVKDYIKKLQNDVAKTAGISRLMILMEHKKIAFNSIAHLHKNWIERKEFESLSDDQKSCIESIDVKIIKKNIPDTEIEIEVEHIKVKLYDKQKSLDSISKMLGYNEPDKIEHSGEVTNKVSVETMSTNELIERAKAIKKIDE